MKPKLLIKAIDITQIGNDAENFMQAAMEVHEQCRTTGVFLLKMPDDVAEQCPSVMAAAKEFFKLSDEEKQELKSCPSSQMKLNGVNIAGTGSGYRGFSEDPNFMSDTRESFNMGPAADETVVKSERYSGSGVTKWPREQALPGWKNTMQRYIDSILASVVPSLRRLLAVALQLPSEFFDQAGYFDNPTWILGLTNYQAVRSDEQAGVYGIRPHCDSGMFTLLLSDGQPGLQVCLDKSANAGARVWLVVEPPPPRHFIVNLGQVLERWSNGMYKAVMHRVMLDGANERLSVPFFYDPNLDLVLEPLVQNEGKDHSKKPVHKSLGSIMLERLKMSDEAFE